MDDFIITLTKRLAQRFDLQLVGKLLADWLMNILVAVTVMAAFYVLWLIVRLTLILTLQRKVDNTTFAFLDTMVKFSLLAIGVITALESASIKTSALLTSLGIVGLTIGFAARDALSNLISGILIFIDRPFVLGDLVEIDGYYGKIDHIILRSTRVVTSDGPMLAVPNTEIINKTVASYTNFPHLRIDVAVTVGVNENIGKVRRMMIALVNHDEAFMTDPAPRVVVTELNDYNVAMELQAWIRDERRHVEKRYELREKLFKTLTQEGVEMPFETLQLQPLSIEMRQLTKEKT